MIHSFENTLLNAFTSRKNTLITAPALNGICSLFPALFAAAAGDASPFALVTLSKYDSLSLQNIFAHFCDENQDLPLNVEFFDAQNLSKIASCHYKRRIVCLTPDDFKDDALTLLAFYLQPSASSPLSLIWPYPVMMPDAYPLLLNAFGPLDICHTCAEHTAPDICHTCAEHTAPDICHTCAEHTAPDICHTCAEHTAPDICHACAEHTAPDICHTCAEHTTPDICHTCAEHTAPENLNIYFVPQDEHFDEHFPTLLHKLLSSSPACLFSNLSADIRLISEFSHRIHQPAEFLPTKKQKMNSHAHVVAYSPHSCFLEQPSNVSSFIAMNDLFDTAVYLHQNVASTSSGHANQLCLSFIADNDFSLLYACAECLHPAENHTAPTPFHTAAKIFCRFAELHHTPCHADTLRSDFGDALARDVFETWRRENFIAPLPTNPCAMTYSDNGQQYFNHTIGSLSPSQHLLYRHPVMCQTPNGENIGFISANMLSLHAATHFNVKNISFRRNTLDIFKSHAVCTVCSPISYPFWLDAMPICLSSPTSHIIQTILCDDLETNERIQKQIKPHLSNDIAHQRIQALNSKFKIRFTTPYPHALHLESFNSNAMLWTFAGASANAICAQFIQNCNPNISVAYGNFAILFASDCAKNLSSLPEYINDFLSNLSGKHPDSPNSIMTLCQSAHPFAPFSKLLPQTVQNDLAHAVLLSLRDAFPDPSFYTHETNDPLFLDIPWTTFPTLKKHIMPKTMPSIHQSCDDATYPINHRTVPFFIDNGCLHTQNPWFFVNSEKQFNRAIDDMLNENIIGLDVETTLYNQDLRLIQIGLRHKTFVIDPLSLDFKNLISVLENPNIIKLIHNASFEKRVLLKYNIQIHNIVDTLSLSKKIYGTRIENGHSLKAVCQRIFGAPLDKTSQTSDWGKRPLSPQQLEYAALDAEILVRIYDKFMSITSAQKN